MAYKGKINVPKNYVYKNKTAYDGTTPTFNSRWENVDIDVANPNDIINQFGDPHFFTGDISHEHPYYFKYVMEDDETQFNFNNLALTFIQCESEANVGIGERDDDFIKYSSPIRVPVDENKYGTISKDSYNQIETGYFGQVYKKHNLISSTIEIIPNFFTYLKDHTLGSANISGIKDIYNKKKDAYLSLSLSDTREMYYLDYQGTGSIQGAYLSEDESDSYRNLTNTGYYHNINDDVRMYFKKSQTKTLRAKTSNGYTTVNISFPGYTPSYYVETPKPGSTNPGDQWVVYFPSYGITAYALLYDGTDVWLLTITAFYAEHYEQESSDSIITRENEGNGLSFMLCKVKDLATNFPQFTTRSDDFVGTLTYPNSNILMNDTFLELINPTDAPGPGPGPGPSDYDDDEKDPGTGTSTNPYENLKNNDAPAVVGGDYDLENHIYDIDDTPNTSYEQFIASTSFFGSYRLSLQNLKNYAESLKLLYDHSTEVAIGSAYSGYANRITEGTVSLFMIPFSSFSPEDYQSETFAVGGSGIKSTEASWSDYIWGRDGAYDTAQLLNTYTKRWTVNLDPIIRKYDNFLDFAPYSKASIFIPYVGQFELPINLIQSSKSDAHKIGLRVKFGLNVSNGDVIAIFEAEIKNSSNQYIFTPLATWTGNCARAIKLAVNDDSQAIREGVRAITSMVSFAASSGASSMISGNTSSGISNSKGDFTPTKTVSSSSVSDMASKGSSTGSGVSFNGNASSAMPSSIAPGQHLIGGATTAGELGWLGVQQIVVKVERPIWWLPADYSDLFGYPTKKYATLRKIRGFATVSRIHLRCSATGPEKEEIERLLSEGVIF